MASWGEPSDSGNNWRHGRNPYNPPETGESRGGPAFLSSPKYYLNGINGNILEFVVRGGEPLTIVIYVNGIRMWTKHHRRSDNNRYNVKVPGCADYEVQLINSRNRSVWASAVMAFAGQYGW